MDVTKFWLDWATVIAGIGGGFTGAGVGVAVWQLVSMKRHSETTFEDALVQEYRQLASTLPLKALLGEPLTETEHADKLDEFYRYFDLCNHQVFLRKGGRVRKGTWTFWKDGIESNLKRPAFARAWVEIAAKAKGEFNELRALCPPGEFTTTKEAT